MSSTREKGDHAENIAVKYLEETGYKIIQRNWYFHHYELDVIAQKDNYVAIIEIKSLLKKSIREPYQAVNWNKQQKIIAATNAFIRKYQITTDVRFDIISIINDPPEPIIEHIENAFYPRVR
jgi:putative endonuclease